VKATTFAAVVVTVALLAAYYVLGTGYLRARRDVAAARSDVTAALQALAQVPLPAADITARLQAAEQDVAGATALFPAPDDVTSLVREVVAVAGASGVQLSPFATQPWTTEEVNGVSVPVLRFTVTASGPYSALRAFLAALETDGPPGLVVGDVTLSGLSATDNATPRFRLDVRAAVYGRPAATEGSGP